MLTAMRHSLQSLEVQEEVLRAMSTVCRAGLRIKMCPFGLHHALCGALRLGPVLEAMCRGDGLWSSM